MAESRDGKDSDGACLAYLTCPQDASRGFLGAILVTDARTRPLHFGYVTPIRPTVIQRILYGKSLDVDVKINVIAKKLLQEGLSRIPDVVFVDSEMLIAARSVFGVPVARLWRRPPDAKEGVTISTYLYDTAGNTADEHAVGRIVTELEQSVDLIDPFDRIQEALKEVLKDPAK